MLIALLVLRTWLVPEICLQLLRNVDKAPAVDEPPPAAK
jgi:hypothetical protein